MVFGVSQPPLAFPSGAEVPGVLSLVGPVWSVTGCGRPAALDSGAWGHGSAWPVLINCCYCSPGVREEGTGTQRAWWLSFGTARANSEIVLEAWGCSRRRGMQGVISGRAGSPVGCGKEPAFLGIQGAGCCSTPVFQFQVSQRAHCNTGRRLAGPQCCCWRSSRGAGGCRRAPCPALPCPPLCAGQNLLRPLVPVLQENGVQEGQGVGEGFG